MGRAGLPILRRANSSLESSCHGSIWWLAGLGVAYRGKPLLAGAADAVIRHADLTALLYLQGYTQADFAG